MYCHSHCNTRPKQCTPSDCAPLHPPNRPTTNQLTKQLPTARSLPLARELSVRYAQHAALSAATQLLASNPSTAAALFRTASLSAPQNVGDTAAGAGPPSAFDAPGRPNAQNQQAPADSQTAASTAQLRSAPPLERPPTAAGAAREGPPPTGTARGGGSDVYAPATAMDTAPAVEGQEEELGFEGGVGAGGAEQGAASHQQGAGGRGGGQGATRGVPGAGSAAGVASGRESQQAGRADQAAGPVAGEAAGEQSEPGGGGGGLTWAQVDSLPPLLPHPPPVPMHQLPGGRLRIGCAGLEPGFSGWSCSCLVLLLPGLCFDRLMLLPVL